MTVRELLLTAPYDPSRPELSRRDAQTLLLHLLGHDRAWLHAHPEAEVGEDRVVAWRDLMQRRLVGEPLQHLTGHQEFFGLDLLVTPDVLIPRPETEQLVERVLAWAASRRGDIAIVDVGTGSGAVALALAHHLREAHITAVDLSNAALDVAGRNAERLEITDRVRFAHSNLLEVFTSEITAGRRFDAIVSNPPYIPEDDAADLAAEVRDHEPSLALFAGEDGMAIYRRLVPDAAGALRQGGLLAMEFGYGQRDAMLALFAAQPAGTWADPQFTPDLQGIPRVVEALRR